MVVESYHSLEDRLVKQAFTAVTRVDGPRRTCRSCPRSCEPAFRLVTRGAERADADEIAKNPRAASVRLRAVERIHRAHRRSTQHEQPRPPAPRAASRGWPRRPSSGRG